MKPHKQIMRAAIKEARRELKQGLALCTEEQRSLFQRGYRRHDKPEASLDSVIDHIPEKYLGSAMQLVQRTLDKNARAAVSAEHLNEFNEEG